MRRKADGDLETVLAQQAYHAPAALVVHAAAAQYACHDRVLLLKAAGVR